jgi:6-phosphogluconolactonase
MSGAEAEVTTYPNADDMARTVAGRLVEHLAVVQSDGRVPSVVLTGGSIADRIHRAVAEDEAVDAVDWTRVDFWFGDERFVAADDGQRNEGQARAAMLDRLQVDPARVHAMPSTDAATGHDVEAAARTYAEDVERALGSSGTFDVVMLGIGPDGHCASLFPGRSEVLATGTAVAVRNSPKPPPTRISLTMEVLCRTDEVWFVAAGEEKSEAVAAAVAGSDVAQVPAAGPKGQRRTLWFVDEAAGSRLAGPSGPAL